MSPERAISNRTLIQKEALPPGKLCQRQQTSKGERALLPFSAQLSKKHFPTLAPFPGARAVPASATDSTVQCRSFSCILLFPLESSQPQALLEKTNQALACSSCSSHGHNPTTEGFFAQFSLLRFFGTRVSITWRSKWAARNLELLFKVQCTLRGAHAAQAAAINAGVPFPPAGQQQP